jgi:Electron transfer DM13
MTDVLDERVTPVRRARRQRPRWVWVAAALVVAVVAFVLFWFQPQKLFIDDRVNDAVPTVTAAPAQRGTAPAAGGPTTTAPLAVAEPVELARGSFVSLDHGTSGVVRLLELGDGRRIVRLEGLDTDNGPDLYLYLTANPAAGDEGTFDDDYVNLGRLKGNRGDQNYDLPANTDLTRFPTVVIWCDRFNSAFGAADLTVA